MATTPEGKAKAKIRAYLATLKDCWYFTPATHGYGVSGVPDIVGCYRGVFFAIEVKAPGNLSRVTTLQQMQIDAINSALGYAIVACDPEPVKAMIVQIHRMLKITPHRHHHEEDHA